MALWGKFTVHFFRVSFLCLCSLSIGITYTGIYFLIIENFKKWNGKLKEHGFNRGSIQNTGDLRILIYKVNSHVQMCWWGLVVRALDFRTLVLHSCRVSMSNIGCYPPESQRETRPIPPVFKATFAACSTQGVLSIPHKLNN